MSPGTPTAFINFKETPNITRNTTGFYADSAASNSTLGIEQGAAGFPNIYADLSTATPVSINDLRQSIQLQRLLERVMLVVVLAMSNCSRVIGALCLPTSGCSVLSTWAARRILSTLPPFRRPRTPDIRHAAG